MSSGAQQHTRWWTDQPGVVFTITHTHMDSTSWVLTWILSSFSIKDVFIYINIRCDCISLSRGFPLSSVGGSLCNFPWTISETWLSCEEHLLFFASFLYEEKRITCSPESVGGVSYDGGPCWAKEKTTFLHVSPVIYLFFHPFSVYSFPRLFCQSVCGLHFVFSPRPWDFVPSPFESNFVLWFFSLLFQSRARTEVFTNLTEGCFVKCVVQNWCEQEVEWCHWQGRIVLRDFKLKMLQMHCEPRCCARHFMFQRPASPERKNTLALAPDGH